MKLTNKISVLLVLALTVNGITFINPTSASAAKKVSLSTKKLTVKVGQSKKLKLKNNKKKATWKVLSGKKNITLKGKKKTGVTVVGKKKGSAKVQAKIGKKKYACKVTVKAKKAKPTPKPTPKPTAKSTPKPTTKPTKTPGQDVLTLYYNGKNEEDIRNIAHGSKIPVHLIVEDGVTSISRYAVSDCSELTSITIPASVTSIGEGVFCGCGNLTSITVAEGNRTYDSRNNCNAIIETDTNTLIRGCKNTMIPASVTSIGKFAFYHCDGLTNITISDSVISIGDRAFMACRELTSITIPDSVTSIGEGVFYACSVLASITIPDSVTSIGEWAFRDCSGLNNITMSNNVTNIGEFTFLDCSSLTSITIPASVTSIGREAFDGCGNLTSITVAEGNSIYDSRDNCNAVIETDTNTLIRGCKNTAIPDNVTSIGDRAFMACRELTSITIPASVTSIGRAVFKSCSGLTSITVAEGNRIYDSRNNCNAIIETDTNILIAGCKNTVIPDNVTSIGVCAFMGCSKLTSITIPDSVLSIMDGAFYDCISLTSITIGRGVNYISDADTFGDHELQGHSAPLTSIKWNGNTYASLREFFRDFYKKYDYDI